MWLWRACGGGALALLLAMALSDGAAETAQAPSAKTPSRAVWVWGQTVREEKAERVAARLMAAHLDTALLLVKGGSGTASFAARSAVRRQPGGDVLQQMLDACRPRGIGVHAWFIFHGDAAWVKAHPDEARHSCGTSDSGATRPSDEGVCPAAPGYRAYLQQLISELLERYPVDGLHLDCIRYPTLASCFCPRHRELARQAGIDFAKVRQAAIKSTHDSAARSHLIDLYRQGDPDVRRWVDLRREEIDSFVRQTARLLRQARPGAQLSAALMPEGADDDDAFALCHYAQDYRTVGAACDFICPMSYHASYGKPAIWPAEVAVRAAKRSGRPALAGLQAFAPSTAANLGDGLREVQRRHLAGFALFRYGSMTPDRWALLTE